MNDRTNQQPTRGVNPSRQTLFALAAAVVGGLCVGGAGAATYTYDGNTSVSGAQDGGGDWDTVTSNWWDASTTSNVVWPNVTGHVAAFGAGVDGDYTINLPTAVTSSTVSFLNSGYKLTANSAVSVGSVSTFSVAPGKSATIGQNVTVTRGAAGTVSFSGGGTVNVAGTNAVVSVGGSFQNIGITGNTTVDVQTGGVMYTSHMSSVTFSVDSGTLKVSGGSVQIRNDHNNANASAANLVIGSGSGNTGNLTLDSGSVAIYRTSRVTATISERVSGNLIVGTSSGTGIANLNGGTLIVPNTRYAGGTDAGTNGAIVLGNGNNAKATLNVNGTAASVGPTSVRGLRFFNTDAQSNSTATVNLTAGTLTVPIVTTYATHGSGTSGTFNFNGGTLQANATQSSFFGAANANLLDVTAIVKAGGAKIDTNSFDIGIGQALLHDSSLGSSPDGGLTKQSTGTLTLSNANTYTGNTTVEAGTLALASTGSLLMDINPASNTRILGAGAVTLDGRLRFDVSDIPEAGTWQIVNVDTLAETFGSNFSVALAGPSDTLFSQNADVWTLVDGERTWTFTESTGVLTAVVPEPASLSLLGIGAALFLRRRRV